MPAPEAVNEMEMPNDSAAVPSNASISVATIRNLTRNTQIADKAEIARTGTNRSRGLLGRKQLEPGGGMWILPCEAVHTFFMQFPIDLIYIDRKHRVKKVRANVPPWRFSGCLSAHSVIELPAGTIRATQTQPGDLLEVSEATLEST
jgi:uncharacterized membrane protein (UPF0127 family)